MFSSSSYDIPALYCSIQEDISHKSGQEPKMHPRTKERMRAGIYYSKISYLMINKKGMTININVKHFDREDSS